MCIDAKYGFIRRHVITTANRHDSQMFMVLLGNLWETGASYQSALAAQWI
ncbi:MAG: hypothetical protein ERJ68_08225 [Aphanocapsa feldmannii 277cI]|uniref:Transposase n=1 Tax=Aphanocapsa feldmannii 277cI TaxID=2507554 RepID=A0A524RRY3_9CHRO|nr:MAG: hypothetical protein ERJ68_08225 [Aphanocapsa feldmannii 277cI]